MARTGATRRFALCSIAILLGAPLLLIHREARAQDENPPTIVGPPRPPAPSPPEEDEENSSTPHDAVNLRPIEAASPEPEEPRAPRFGSAGVVVVSDGVTIAASTTRYDSSAASVDSVTLTPGFDYFAGKGLSIGLELTAGYSQSRGYGADSSLVQSTTTTIGAGPRFGLNVAVSRLVSFFPRLTLAVTSEHHEQHLVTGQTVSTSGSPLGLQSTTQIGPTVDLFGPLLFHPVPHFFIGVGPDLFHQFGRAQGGPDVGGERTTIRARFVIGTWWGGAVEGASDAPPPPPPPNKRDPRFGDQKQLVITGEAGIGVNETIYSGSDSHLTSVSVSPGFDYFVVSDISIGVSASVQFADQTGLEPTGETVHYQRGSYTLEPRMGFNLPLGSFVSLYPRIAVGGGVRTYDETNGLAENKSKTGLLFLDAYVPILLHIAPHAFFGFGPSVSHELIDKQIDAPGAATGSGNLATSVGAGFIVGGWL